MPDQKLTQLGDLPAIAVDDLLYVVDASTGLSKKITLQNLLAWLGGTITLGTDASGVALGLGIKIGTNGILKANRGGANRSIVGVQDAGTDSCSIDSGEGSASAGHVRFYSDAGTHDTKLKRIAAGIAAAGDSTTGAGWLQNTAGVSRVNGSAVTNGTITPTNITGLSATLVAGRKYSGSLSLRVSNTVAVDGLRLDFDGGTATMTSFEAGVTGGGLPTAATFSVAQSSALATDIIATTMGDTNSKWISIDFGMVVNAAGTFIPRIALEALSTGVISVHPNSYMLIEDTP